MSAVSIEFRAQGAPEEAGVATDIFDAFGRRVWQGATTLTDATPVDLGPGTYLIRAHLPSGTDAVGQVTVPDETSVILHPEHESVAPSFASIFYLKRPSRTHPGNSLEAGDLTVWARAVQSTPLDPAVLEATAGSGEWTRDRIELKRGMHASHCELRFVEANAARGIFAQLRFWGTRSRDVQTWLTVRSQLFAIPSGIMSEATVQPDGAGEFRVSIYNLRADADAVLGYLSDGDFVSARTVGKRLMDPESDLESAHALLCGYAPNPGAAAIAGYYVIRAFAVESLSVEQRDRLDKWVFDLATLFPALPDGAVVFGWNALRKGDVESAGEAFIEACRRGIPMYTMGMRYLVDGLRMIKKSADADRALEWLTSYVRFADWTAQTTTLAVETPFQPFEVAPRRFRQPTLWWHDAFARPPEVPFALQRAELTALTAPPLGPARPAWTVAFTPGAARRAKALDTDAFTAPLMDLIAGIRDNPKAYRRWRGGIRMAMIETDEALWLVPFVADEDESIVTILKIKRVFREPT